MLRFRLFGVPFAVAPAFWFGSAIFGYNLVRGPDGGLLLVVWVACVFLSIVVHELGHALTARRYGVQPAVELQTMGGVTRMFGRLLTREEGFWVSLSGPAAGFGLFLVVELLRQWLSHGQGGRGILSDNPSVNLALVTALQSLHFINLYWTLFNMLPILPLDGGQVLRNLLGPRFLHVTTMVGVFCAGAVAVLAALWGQYFVAVFLGYLTYVNFQGNARALPGGTSQ